MPKEKDKDYTTVTLPRSEYEKLVKLRDELMKRPDYSWVGTIGLGAFIGFILGLAANSTKRPMFTCGNCGTQIDLTGWNKPNLQCPKCKQVYIRQPQPQT